MTAILAAIGSKVVLSCLTFIVGWLTHFFQAWQKDRQAAAEDEAKTAAAQKALEEAKTGEELDNAAKQISDGF